MSTYRPSDTLPALEDANVAIVQARWNSHITDALAAGAIEVVDYYRKAVPSCKLEADVFYVPGTVELTFAASKLIETGSYDAVVILGCVIRGDTPHFDYVCQSVTQGMTHLNSECDIPVVFGVITVNDEQQALDRAGGKVGNKGAEAMETALHMIAFNRML